MDHASEEFGIPVLEGTSQELSARSAHGFLRRKEKVTALPPINPLRWDGFPLLQPRERRWVSVQNDIRSTKALRRFGDADHSKHTIMQSCQMQNTVIIILKVYTQIALAVIA